MKSKKLYILLTILIIGIVAVLGYKSTSNTPTATASTVVDIKNGDTYNLSASYVTKEIDGKEQKMLAYNGSVPGPTIEVAQGSEITIHFINNIDMPQLLHSHGVRMDNAYDGSQMVQKELQPGQSFDYKLKFPDAGVYWYHPHANEVYGQALGLYGAFIVKPKDANYFPPVNKEVPLFLSDLPVQNGKIAIRKDGSDSALMGHYGNVMLVNGQEDYELNATSGEVVRFYVINSSNVRPYNFAIGGAKMKLVGGDSGAYEKATYVDSVLLGPSERAIVDVLFDKANTYDILNRTPNNTYTLGKVVITGGNIDASYVDQFNTLQTNKDTVSSIDPFRQYFYKAPDKSLTLTIDMMGGMMSGGNMKGMMHGAGMMGSNGSGDDSQTITLMGMKMTRAQAVAHCKSMPQMAGCEPYLNAEDLASQSINTATTNDGIEWEDTMQMMNQMATKDNVKWKIVDNDTKKSNMDIDWTLKKDQPIKIRIFNDPKSMHPMQHPIHFHGQRFLVVSRNGVIQANLVWKDTVMVKVGETVDIILDPSNPGDWMAHCHISEHLNDGMMFGFKVE